MNFFDSDAFDHKGNPADRTKTGGWLSAAQILGKIFHCLLLCIYIYIKCMFLSYLNFPGCSYLNLTVIYILWKEPKQVLPISISISNIFCC